MHKINKDKIFNIMLGKTHLGGGILASILLCNDINSALLLIFGSMLPDIDHHNGFLGKNVPLIPKLFKHRGFTHSLLFATIIWFLNQWIAYGIIIHIFMDMMTHNGVALLYPLKNKIRFPLARYITTGGWFEKILFYLIYLAIIFLFVNKFIYTII